jgi:hypothetical protein
MAALFCFGLLLTTHVFSQSLNSNAIQLFQSTGKAIPDKQVKNNLELVLNDAVLQSILNSKHVAQHYFSVIINIFNRKTSKIIAIHM